MHSSLFFHILHRSAARKAASAHGIPTSKDLTPHVMMILIKSVREAVQEQSAMASQCTKEGDPSVHSEQLMCTISYSQPSLEHGVCVNDQGTFFCEGIPQGEATCSACAFVANEPDVGVPHVSNATHPDPITRSPSQPQLCRQEPSSQSPAQASSG
ncbi:hypothetical protein PTTG_05210 [Puccinia triticina 1-1 BBBD Race 1]|uniref:Uncharacterized protein n=1 Tax=Puccinia triticina (isolate 1-1 / race 1 (BBBD)) TaxID=630390 RepID=A0A180GQE0_PUCT1|nr:hypothetical protein PTTG_05210 [Puccinia triticina 1-1 BBBD Race 1]